MRVPVLAVYHKDQKMERSLNEELEQFAIHAISCSKAFRPGRWSILNREVIISNRLNSSLYKQQDTNLNIDQSTVIYIHLASNASPLSNSASFGICYFICGGPQESRGRVDPDPWCGSHAHEAPHTAKCLALTVILCFTHSIA